MRVFVAFHDPALTERVPHSTGLQKGMLGAVNAFASADHAGSNDVVIAHELLHTLGATDKYDPATNQPRLPGRLRRAGRATAPSAAARRDHGRTDRRSPKRRPRFRTEPQAVGGRAGDGAGDRLGEIRRPRRNHDADRETEIAINRGGFFG